MRIKRSHTLGSEEAKRRVDMLAGDLGKQLALNAEWRGDDLKVSGTGVDGQIAVAEDSIEVDIQLGFALKLMEGTIRSAIENAMDEHLA